MIKAFRFAAVIALVLTATTIAETTQTTSDIKDPTAKSAFNECDVKVAAAKAVYDKAVLSAKQALLAKLEIALTNVTKSGDLDEALKIKDAIQNLKAEIAAMQSGIEVKTAQVFAASDWTAYGKVERGQKIKLSASGQWNTTGKPNETSYADGKMVNGKGLIKDCILKGRIGKQEFVIGLGTTVVVEEDGVFEMRSNDNGSLKDNSGSLAVKIELLATEP